MKRKATKIMLTLVLASMLFTALESGFSNGALVLEDVTTWQWGFSTIVFAVAVGDVDGDLAVEIVTGGYYGDYGAGDAQLAVWNGATLALEGVRTWHWPWHTDIYSVAIGDVDGDGATEIVTGGEHLDGTRFRAQLAVWDGATLSLEDVRTWYWVDSTALRSVAIGDVDGDGATEIVTGGYYWDGTRFRAQLAVWNGATLALEGVRTWYWVDHTVIKSVAVGDVDGDGSVEIVTGGYHHDGTRDVAQLVVWDGSTLALEDVRTWHWGDDTVINSVACANVDGDAQVEIVTGGRCYDGTHRYAQLAVWNGATLGLEGVETWMWATYPYIGSVSIGDVDGDGATEIVTGGSYSDGTYSYAQLVVWDGSTLGLECEISWYWVDDTYVNQVATGDVDGDGVVEIVTGGNYLDGGNNAQLVVWTKT